MFFVSEEFLRKYEAGEDANQTIDEAVAPGEGLFDNVSSKREHNIKRRRKSAGGDAPGL